MNGVGSLRPALVVPPVIIHPVAREGKSSDRDVAAEAHAAQESTSLTLLAISSTTMKARVRNPSVTADRSISKIVQAS